MIDAQLLAWHENALDFSSTRSSRGALKSGPSTLATNQCNSTDFTTNLCCISSYPKCGTDKIQDGDS